LVEGILDNNEECTVFADKLLSDDGFDPYLQDEATLWILHYNLVKKGYATSYYLIFNELRKERIEFNEDQFVNFVKRKLIATPNLFNANTIKSDFDVFHKLYVGTQSQDKEDVIAGIMRELRLVKSNNRVCSIQDNEKTEIPDIVLMYVLLENPDFGLSVNLESMVSGHNTIGSIFAINRTGLLNKIESLVQQHDFLVFKDDAGIKELQFKNKPDPITILENYYAN
jgi:hypothetical protein